MGRIAWMAVIAVLLLAILVLGSGFLIPPGWGCCGGWMNQGGWSMMGRGGMGPWMMGGFGVPLIGGILMLLFWALVIGGIVWLGVWLARGGAQSASSALTDVAAANRLPLDIIKARYAKGEISKEQFEDMKRNLG